MKSLFLLLTCTFGMVLAAHAGDETLTAEELARHFHVYSWVTKIDLQGKQLKIDVVHVKNGKIKSTLFSNDAFPTDREFERIVVLADQTPLGTKVSIQPGASAKMTMSREQPSETVSLTMTIGIADKVTPGDYYLGGDILLEGNRPSAPVKIEEVKDGLILRLYHQP